MKFDLLVDSRPNEVVIALLKDKQLIELHKEPRDNSYSVGDIYLGKVKKVVSGLNACFVDVGYDKDGFDKLGKNKQELTSTKDES